MTKQTITQSLSANCVRSLRLEFAFAWNCRPYRNKNKSLKHDLSSPYIRWIVVSVGSLVFWSMFLFHYYCFLLILFLRSRQRWWAFNLRHETWTLLLLRRFCQQCLNLIKKYQRLDSVQLRGAHTFNINNTDISFIVCFEFVLFTVVLYSTTHHLIFHLFYFNYQNPAHIPFLNHFKLYMISLHNFSFSLHFIKQPLRLHLTALLTVVWLYLNTTSIILFL